ncbi:EAL domain-containing protein [Shewanella mesophila]|uniref:GGDEF domain-containing phosphodiesterase n=1 Tax=Shewanella mesophila TaxID=2864208 RepID=UPI001C659A1B|nr:GGDEF domain-containing phosphodiesterase [Shewanella mesophila]QYJ86157.1 EAL domain-containing protein [Shewanella mesophila]
MSFVNHFLLLSDDNNSHETIPNWQISALRIILLSGLLLCVATAIDIFNSAIKFNYLWMIALTICFSSAMFLLLIASKRFYYTCSHLLLITIVLASVAMNLFLYDLELAKIGSMLMFVCPVIALMLIGYKSALGYALLNIVPFYIILHDIDLSILIGRQHQLPDANWYITGLIFLFFNICVPLAVARTIVAAKRLNDATLCSNAHLKDKNKLYRTFFIDSHRPKIIVDKHGNICDFNGKAAKLFGLKVRNSDDNKKRISTLIPSFNSEQHNPKDQILQYKDFYLRVINQKVSDSNFNVYDFYDCTAEQSIKSNLAIMEQENKRLRYRDSQTLLPNRDWFELQCDRLIAKRYKRFYVVVAQNVNNEYLNLKFGNLNSQKITVAAYKRLKGQTDAPLLCAHIGLGKIAFILGSHHKEGLENTLSKIKAILDKNYRFLGVKSAQSFVFGVAQYPEHGNSSSKVISHALETVKLANNDNIFSIYNETNSQSFLEKYELSMLLDEALQQGELEIHYQPKVTAAGQCIGFEALARWHSPILGIVSPTTFIPIAEEYRMISRLTDLVVQKVCAQIAEWTNKGISCVPIAINISLLDFSQSDFLAKLVKHLADFNVRPNQIELELTETALEANKGLSLNLLKTLQSWGFTISVDDFGVGYSNIARLADYPIDKLKLDRSLINQVTTSKRQRCIVKTIHNMCEELEIKCVSEGVETEQQVQIMTRMGCKEFQGFYFSKPLTVNQLSNHVQKHGLIFTPNKPAAETPQQIRSISA